MFLNRRKPADLAIVGEGFVISGDQAFHLLRARVLQHFDAHVAVQKQPIVRDLGVSRNDWRLNKADFSDGCGDLPVLPAGFRSLAHCPEGQDRFNAQGDTLVLEPLSDPAGRTGFSPHDCAPSMTACAR